MEWLSKKKPEREDLGTSQPIPITKKNESVLERTPNGEHRRKRWDWTGGDIAAWRKRKGRQTRAETLRLLGVRRMAHRL